MSDSSAIPQVIVTADDFGRCDEINRAVIQAFREGVLTAASLMVGAPAAEQAVELARQNPALAVGLHVVVVDGDPVLPPERIPRLVDASGRFPSDPFRVGVNLALHADAREQLAMELRAQFERFAAFGLPLAHADGHLQMHVHPVVFDLLSPLLREFGAKGLRLPRDELGISLRHDRTSPVARVSRTVTLRLLSRRCLRRARAAGVRYTDRVYGVAQSGRMDEQYVARVLDRLHVPTAELIFHPTCGAALNSLGPNPRELAVLLSPLIRQIVERRRLRLTSYPFLETPSSG